MCIRFFASDYILSYFTNPVHCIEKINRNMTFVRRKHHRLFILIVILTILFLFINWLSDNVLAGEILKDPGNDNLGIQGQNVTRKSNK